MQNIFGIAVNRTRLAVVRIQQIPFIFILIALQIYLLINGKAHFPDWSSTYGELILIYLLMTIVFLFFARKRLEADIKKPFKTSMFAFSMFFIATFMLMSILVYAGFLQAGTVDKSLFWQTIIIQIAVIATAEELMFRGVLLQYTGIIISSVLFALWHSYAYQIVWYNLDVFSMNYVSLIIAFIMGLILALITRNRKYGLPASIGVHSAFNIVLILGGLIL